MLETASGQNDGQVGGQVSTCIAKVATQQHLSVPSRLPSPSGFPWAGQEVGPSLHRLAIDQFELLNHFGVLSMVGQFMITQRHPLDRKSSCHVAAGRLRVERSSANRTISKWARAPTISASKLSRLLSIDLRLECMPFLALIKFSSVSRTAVKYWSVAARSSLPALAAMRLASSSRRPVCSPILQMNLRAATSFGFPRETTCEHGGRTFMGNRNAIGGQGHTMITDKRSTGSSHPSGGPRTDPTRWCS